jgi:hypothetical protein
VIIFYGRELEGACREDGGGRAATDGGIDGTLFGSGFFLCL